MDKYAWWFTSSQYETVRWAVGVETQLGFTTVKNMIFGKEWDKAIRTACLWILI